MGLQRIKLLQQKKNGINNQQKREIASLLEKGKEESARIRVEHIIREDYNIEALEILELYSELLLARFGLLEHQTFCDDAIKEAVNTVIFSALRFNVQELIIVRDQLILKFGKDFGASAMENRNGIVNDRIVQKLKVQTPDPVLVDQYLNVIAEAFNIKFESQLLREKQNMQFEENDKDGHEKTNGNTDFNSSVKSGIPENIPVPLGFPRLSQLQSQQHPQNFKHQQPSNEEPAYTSQSEKPQYEPPQSFSTEAKTFDTSKSKVVELVDNEDLFPTVPVGKNSIRDSSFDDLSKRFAALKNKK
ncbi:Vacuolar protein sorting-associated protein ist1 [Lobulomyces angularis]|nr:Vacuolar protein sorting-associated protein ist1 [Lobulomyces angularis]